MKKRVWSLPMVTASVLLATLAAGCSDTETAAVNARQVTLVATEMKFEPARITAKAGESIRFTIENRGTVLHEFESAELKFKEVEVPAGQSRSVVVTMPDQPGEYTFVCDQPGHLAGGMTGVIEVSK